MSDSQNSGFGKFVPGFDFLQNLAKGATQNIPQLPNLANWIAPTLNVEELEKRIEELKTVHFWLEQNSKALGATIQALEVQKMTLATLKGMNFNIGDVANALKLKAADTVFSGVQRVTDKATSTAHSIAEMASDAKTVARNITAGAAPAKSAATATALVDPMQLWSSLTQQFQQIAATAMKDIGKNTAMDMTKNMAAGLAKEAVKATKKAASNAVKSRTSAKKTVRKTPAKGT